MTVYVHKVDADIDVGESEGGPDPTSFVFATDKLQAKGWRHDGDGAINYWRFPLGVTLNETNSFYARFRIKTQPIDMTGTNSAGLYFGFKNSSDGFTIINAVLGSVTGKYPSGVGGRTGGFVAYTNKSYSGTTTNYDWSANTDYVMEVIFNSVTHILSILIWNSDMSVNLSTMNTASIGANTFEVDTVGLCAYAAEGGSTQGSFAEYLEITEIHVNSGITYEAPGPSGNKLLLLCRA